MEAKYRTLIQAAVMIVLLVCAIAVNNGRAEPSKATAEVAASE